MTVCHAFNNRKVLHLVLEGNSLNKMKKERKGKQTESSCTPGKGKGFPNDVSDDEMN